MASRDDWNLRMVRAREALALLPRSPEGGTDWGDIRVAHLDTGYTKHPVFGDWQTGNSWLQPGEGHDFLDGDDPLDPCDYEGSPGHGTRTASVLCGLLRDPAAGSELGVAPGLPVVPYRVVRWVVLSPERARERVAQAIRLAIARGIPVVSISLGVPFFPPGTTGGMGRAMDEAYEAGAIVVAAAGQFVDRVTYPGKYDRTLCVGGVTRQRRIWFDYGAGRDAVDVWAPAHEVLRAEPLPSDPDRALPPVEGDDPGSSAGVSSRSSPGTVGKGSGTSYATVHVAAAAALWLRLRGAEAAQRYPQPWQRVEAFRLLLRRTAAPLNGATPAPGSGILDMRALLEADLPAPAELAKRAEDADKWA
ncbi:Subtilisin BL [bacterium HR40]|nr:Subtilisin BL [bacterium HR40]